MKKKILIIGFGSIGQKHASIFNKLNCQINIISSQPKIFKYKKIDYRDIKNYEPDIVIIATTTNMHFQDLKITDNILKNKIILVEKPLFNKNINFSSKRNTILVAYNLRFLPIIKFLKKICSKNKPLNCEVKCHSFLPKWRKRKYILTSSAKKKLGGGVLNDLSHEIDICFFLFKFMKNYFLSKNKLSNLKIDTEDYAYIICKNKDLPISISLSYFTKIEQRNIFLEFRNFSIEADLLNNICFIKKKNLTKKIKFKKTDTYSYQAKNLIKSNLGEFCTIKEGLKVLNVIHKI